MEKYQNKTPVMKFIHKNTGFIICGVILAIAIPLFYAEQGKLEFFEKWTCEQIRTYYLLDGGGRFPKVSELNTDQTIKFNNIMFECGWNKDNIGVK